MIYIKRIIPKSFIIFLIGGLINYILKVGLTALLTEVENVWYIYSYTTALFLSIVFGYFYNAHLTYKVTDKKLQNFIKFTSFIIVFAILDVSLVSFLTEILMINYLVSIVIVTTILFVLKYITYGKFVFVKKKAGQTTGLLSPLLEVWRINKSLRWTKYPDILDVGCGTGRLLDFIQRKVRYHGIDIDKEVIKKAKKKYPRQKFYTGKVEDVKIKQKYDTIFMVAVIEHLPNPDRTIKSLKELLKPKGRIIITTPTRKAEMLLQTGSKIGIFSKEAEEEHETYFDRKTLYSIIRKNGLKVGKYSRFQFGLNQIIVAYRPS